jgi:hypothetical protein
MNLSLDIHAKETWAKEKKEIETHVEEKLFSSMMEKKKK